MLLSAARAEVVTDLEDHDLNPVFVSYISLQIALTFLEVVLLMLKGKLSIVL